MIRRVFIFFSFATLAILASTEVENVDRPTRGEWDLRPIKVWEATRYGDNSMAMPALAAVLDDGTVVVYDQKRHENHLFDAAGRHLAAFAPRGEGPGEVKMQRRVFAVGRGIVVSEVQRLHRFSSRGVFLKTVLLQRDYGHPDLFIDENTYLSSTLDGDRFGLIRVDTDRGERRVIRRIEGREGMNTVAGGFQITVVIPPLTPAVCCDIDPERQRLYFAVNDRYRIHVLDSQGVERAVFSLDREAVPLTRAMKKKINREMHLSKTMWQRLPQCLTYFSHIQVIGNLILVFPTHFEDQTDALWIDIFSTGGEYIHRAAFRPGGGAAIDSSLFYRPVIRGGFLYLVLQDEDGDLVVAKYGVTLPSGT